MILNPVRLETTEIICEYKKEFDPEKNIKSVLFAARNEVEFKGDIDTNKLGKYKGQYIYNGKTIDVSIEVKDLKAPVLKLNDHTTDIVEEIAPELFVESVEDDTEVKLSFEKEPSNREGEHEVLIIATDQSGNETKETAKLKRIKDK